MDTDIKELDTKSFDEILKDSDKLIIVEFYTTTCPNCRAIAPVYSELAKELQKNAIFAKINAQNNSELSMRYGIMGVPTFKFFCQGKPIGELVGAIHATVLRNTIKDLIKHRMECASKSTKLAFEIDGYG